MYTPIPEHVLVEQLPHFLADVPEVLYGLTELASREVILRCDRQADERLLPDLVQKQDLEELRLSWRR
jgi:hypothetical protein